MPARTDLPTTAAVSAAAAVPSMGVSPVVDLGAPRGAFSPSGLPELQAALIADGWRLYRDGMESRYNQCDWYACKPNTFGGPDCECNDKVPQFVLRPVHFRFSDHDMQSVEVDCTGETGGEWFKLAAYSIPADQAMAALPMVLPRLAAAWRAVAGHVETVPAAAPEGC